MAEQDISGRLEGIEARLDELRKAQAGAKNAGRIAVVAIVVVAMGMIAFAISPFIQLAREPEPLTAQLAAAVERDIAPQAQEEAALLVGEVLPVYEAAAGRLVESAYPVVAGRLESELKQFRGAMANGAKEKVSAFSRQVFAENEELLLAWLPELALEGDATKVDEKKAEEYAGRVARVFENAGARVAQDLFGPHYQSVSRLELAFEQFEVPTEVAVMPDQALRDHVADIVVRLADASLDPPAPATE